jgi:putative transposase
LSNRRIGGLSLPQDVNPLDSAAHEASPKAQIRKLFLPRLGLDSHQVPQLRLRPRICFDRRKVNLSLVFTGQKIGISQIDDHLWLASFMHYDLGYFDDETCRLEPITNPFGPKMLPMSSE